MGERRGTPVWKIVLGVFGGLLLAGTCVGGACLVLIGRGALAVADRERQQSEQSAYAEYLALKIDDVDINYGHVTLHGHVKNTGDKTVRYWKATIKFLDAEGGVLDSAFTNSLQRLGPGESVTFEVMRRDVGAKKTAWTVDEVRLE
jgi:hypothetical protein